MSDFILISEKVLQGLGILQLLEHSKNKHQYLIQLDLDAYHSNSQRDWLALRWQEDVLFCSILVQLANNVLRVNKPFIQQDRASAATFVESWCNNLRKALERMRQSRI